MGIRNEDEHVKGLVLICSDATHFGVNDTAVNATVHIRTVLSNEFHLCIVNYTGVSEHK